MYAPMSRENRWLLDYAINMYLDQEKGFGDETQKIINLPGLPNFIVHKYVYDPGHVNIALAWPEWISARTSGKSFLDMGTGTGIAAIYVALYGNPVSVTATDISPMAVTNCKANATQYGLDVQSLESDIYSAIGDKRYDIAFWNFPWNAPDMDVEACLAERGIEVTPERLFQMRAGLDKQYEALRRFISQGKNHLNPGGEILLGASELCRHDIICGEAERYGYHLEIAAEKVMKLSKLDKSELKIILYRLY